MAGRRAGIILSSGPTADSPLPRVLLLTDRRASEARGRSLVDTVSATCAAGIRGVVLREKDLDRERRRDLGRDLTAILSSCAGRLIVATDWELAAELGAGVHLAAADPAPEGVPLAAVGRSCHTVADLRRAAAEGLAYATLSPVFTSISKPGYAPTLGAKGLAAAVSAVPGLRVYALGGVGEANAALCLSTGAAGIAVMGSLMGAEDPRGAARALLTALAGRDQRKRPGVGR